MTSQELRKKYLEFFREKGHMIVPSSSLVPSDPSVLLTSAGMQQFKSYYLNEKSPYGENVTSVQKCFRTSDLDSIGDESHLSFFEMLGNFSFGGYFKEEAIKYAHEFITKEMGLKIDYVSVFKDDSADGISEDRDSEKIWKSIDPSLKIVKAGKTDNFWGPTGSEGPCGPTTEIYVNNVEIWNLVFNEYYKDANGKYSLLKTPGVDTGMGLERLAMVSQGKNNVFDTDLFQPFNFFTFLGRDGRIIADHLRGSMFLIADGIKPSNKGAGYILRRLIRRIVVICKINSIPLESLISRVERAINYYNFYKELPINKDKIIKEIKEEVNEFNKIIEKGLNEFFKKYPEMRVEAITPGKAYKFHAVKIIHDAFYFHQTFGLTIDIIKDLAKKSGHIVDEDVFNREFQKHQQLSRTASVGMFKSGLADHSEQVIKYHTAAHLMLAALRKVLGKHVSQKGSNITGERLRFDFSHPEKMTSEQIKLVEDAVNEKIQEDLPVKMEEMSLEEAKKQGAMGVFESKYGERVKVYTIKDNSSQASSESPFSREICGGPHVERTGLLGKFKIIKEESSSAGVRRIKAVLS
ncbi:MAG: alanine--tRNA ligase [Candidatus Tagabacteria bacterium CG_4_10_14_0_2_um_filter_40_13]|nr:MAG: alanine--tRNA ligase [Candidatus Tagabacteria bacterium CG_4_10_14_0_2_um_filter_40_13]